MTPAVLFDVDGTLLDSNYLHVHAWWEAFEAAGHRVSAYDIHRSIGLPGSAFVEAVLGRTDEALVEAHAARWAELRPRCRPFDGAGDLLVACAERGARVAWVTSADEEDLEGFRRALDRDNPAWRDAVREVVSSADVEEGKPSPEGLLTALERLGCEPSAAAFVGDTTYDVRAAKAAGVRAVALTCGGIGEDELREAGADVVVGNPTELLAGLGDLLGLEG